MTPLLADTVARYRSGLGINEIARQDGVSPIAIWMRLKRSKEKPRPRRARRGPVYPLIEAYDRLQSWMKVAEAMGLNSEQIAHGRARNVGFASRNISSFRLLTPAQKEAYRIALDEDCLMHQDALEIAREY